MPSKKPTKPGLWWAAFDDSEKVTEVVLIEIGYFQGTNSFSEGAIFRVIDGTSRNGSIHGDICQPLVYPSWDIVIAHRTRATVDQVRLTWLRECRPPKLPVSVGSPVFEEMA